MMMMMMTTTTTTMTMMMLLNRSVVWLCQVSQLYVHCRLVDVESGLVTHCQQWKHSVRKRPPAAVPWVRYQYITYHQSTCLFLSML